MRGGEKELTKIVKFVLLTFFFFSGNISEREPVISALQSPLKLGLRIKAESQCRQTAQGEKLCKVLGTSIQLSFLSRFIKEPA